jgi:hypothetical protein
MFQKSIRAAIAISRISDRSFFCAGVKATCRPIKLRELAKAVGTILISSSISVTSSAVRCGRGDARDAVKALIVANGSAGESYKPPFLMAMRMANSNPCRPTARTGTIE